MRFMLRIEIRSSENRVVKLNGEIKESVKGKIAKSLVSQDFLQAYLV